MQTDKPVKRTLRLYQTDLDIISEHFPRQGYNVVVRRIVSLFADNLRKKNKFIAEESEDGNTVGTTDVAKGGGDDG